MKWLLVYFKRKMEGRRKGEREQKRPPETERKDKIDNCVPCETANNAVAFDPVAI